MWSLYLKSDDGIAIQSTFDKLDNSLKDDIRVDLGKINYIDYTKDIMNLDNSLFAFFYKRKSFIYEHELRAAFTQIPLEKGGFINLADFDKENSGDFDIERPLDFRISKLNIDLDILIEKIYVSPTSEDWLLNIVNSLVDKYDLNKEVKRSDLRDDPLY
jgi:hypothetical protein